MARTEILVINLDRSPARLARIDRQLRGLGLDYVRVPAVDGAALPPETLERLLARRRYFRELIKGEVGATLSHRACWQRVVDTGLEWALVLEDDVDLAPEFAAVPAALDGLKPGWEMVRLSNGWRRRHLRPVASAGPFQLVSYFKIASGLQGYAVSRRGAEHLLRMPEAVRRPIDVDLQCWWEHGVEILGLSPFAVASMREDASDIWAGLRERKPTLPRMRFALWFWLMNLRSWGRMRREARTWRHREGHLPNG